MTNKGRASASQRMFSLPVFEFSMAIHADELAAARGMQRIFPDYDEYRLTKQTISHLNGRRCGKLLNTYLPTGETFGRSTPIELKALDRAYELVDGFLTEVEAARKEGRNDLPGAYHCGECGTYVPVWNDGATNYSSPA